MQAKQNIGPRVVRIGMIKGKESPAIGRRVIKTSRYPLAPDEDVRRLTRTMNTRFTSGEKIAVGEDGGRKRRISSFLRFVPTKVDRADQHVAASSSIFVKIKGNTSMSIRTISFTRKRKSTDNDNHANKTSGCRIFGCASVSETRARARETGGESPCRPRSERIRAMPCNVPRSYPVPDAQSYGFALGTLLSDRASGNRISKVLACTCKRDARGDSNDDRVEIRPVRITKKTEKKKKKKRTTKKKKNKKTKIKSSWKERDERTYNLHKIKRDRVVQQEEKLGGERESERERERSSWSR
ncbi:hypothetical protein ALC56_03204 [Trachymyrmex septentrionalis]|uniref:Uncharacterized protein n=1 Tax=Trachymyrmex septentrionalis TaxID=34720 RepID=A0A195FNS5_9HYME|nr:hypothetical protein ALC56_03204 [Trachymyrmex septentrionalis]